MHRPNSQINRREFLRFSAAAATLGALAACAPNVAPGGSPSTGESAAAPAAAPITLKMVSWHFNEELLALFEGTFVPAFQQEYSNISFEFIATDNARINDQLLSAFAAGDGPDLWEHGSAASGAGWAASGQAAALDDFWADYERRDDYLPNAVETAYLDGKLYSIPRKMSPYTIFYRKDFFAEAGIDPGEGPDTWEDYLEMALALTVRKGDQITRAGSWTPTASFDGIQMGWWHYVYQNEGSILNEDMTQAAFDSPEAIEGIQWYHDLLWKHEVDVLGGIGSGIAGKPVNIGTAAMGYGPVEFLREAENNLPEVVPNLGVFKPTQRKRRAGLLAIDRIFLSQSGHLPEAWAWLEFLHRPENMSNRYLVDGTLPPTYSFINSDLVAENPLLQDILRTAEYGYQWPPSPKWNHFRSFIPSMSEAALSSPQPVEATVKQFASEVNAVLRS